MVEALSQDLTVQDLMKYYDVSDFPFNFNFVVQLEAPMEAAKVKEQVDNWLDNTPDGKTPNWVVSFIEPFCFFLFRGIEIKNLPILVG